MKGSKWFVMVVLLLASLVLALGGGVALADDGELRPPSSPEQALLRFTGVVSSRPEGTTVGIWLIDDRSVKVTDSTLFAEEQGPAVVGAHVMVFARRVPMTTAGGVDLEAVLIRVLATLDSARSVTIRGFVTELETTYLAVNGLHISYDCSTQITGKLEVGALVKVVAVRTADGLKALSIEVLPNNQRIIEFEGTIQYIGQPAWVIGGRRVKVTRLTVIIGQPKVGLQAKVWAQVQTNGELQALIIHMQDEPEKVEWRGVIEQLPPNITIYPPTYIGRWVVGGRLVWVTRETDIVGTPRIGLWAHVVAHQYPQGPLVAKRIRVIGGPATETPTATRE